MNAGRPDPDANGGHEYRVRSRTERFRSRVFTVVTDEVAMPGGRFAERDYLVHIGAVGVVALDEAERVVLVRQYRHPLGRYLWELPAGLIDVAGEPLVDAAARELAEEADLTARRWDLLVDANTTPGCSNEVIRIFLARDLSPVPPQQCHGRVDEEAEMVVRRVDLDEAVAMAFRGEITNAACLIGVFAVAQARALAWSTLRSATESLVRTGPPPLRTDGAASSV